MKIAYVYDAIYPYSIGGVEARVWELATRLTGRGHECHIFGPKYWPGASIIKKDGVYLHGVCNPPRKRFVNGRRSITEAIYFSCRVLPPLLREQFDIIDCQNFPYFPCFSTKLASIIKRSCLIITWHEVWDNYWFSYLGKKGIFGKVVERLTTRLTDEIIANSESTKRALVGIGFTKDIKVIPNGIDFEEIRKVSPSNESSDIIYAGRLIKDKNIDLLVRSIALVKAKIPDIRCVIIGDGPERDNLERLIHKLNLEDNISMVGFVEEHGQVLSHMKSSRVFSSPSTREGFGIVALEANACSLPIITVNHPQNAVCDLITEGKSGFICELSEQDIARKILEVLDNKQGFGSKCIDFAQRFDWPAIAAEVEKAYQEVTNIA